MGHNKTENNERNWLCKLKKFEKILDSWRSRKLTIFGKCQLINSLLISKVLYTATILENPEQSFIKSINKIIFSFIWGNRERIKRNTLIRNINEGGIGITDFESKLKAIKASWVSKIIQNRSSLSSLLNACVVKHNIDIPFLLNSSITRYEEFKLNSLPVFYKEVLVAFNECKDISLTNFANQNIWFNKNICFKGKSLFFSSWTKGGLLLVKDLFSENGFKTINDIKGCLASTNNFLCEYLIVKNAIKMHLSRIDLRTINSTNSLTKLHFYFEGKLEDTSNKKSNFFYSILVKKKSQKPIMENIWCKEFQIDKYYFNEIYKNKVRSLFDKSVAEFNYKLLHNLLTTNLSVSKWDKNINGNCNNCNIPENIKHLIFECGLLMPLWRKISLILNIDVTWKLIVVGFIFTSNKNTFILDNTLSFIACKIYKYKMKCRILNEHVSLEGMRCFLKNALLQLYLTVNKSKCINLNFSILEKLSNSI